MAHLPAIVVYPIYAGGGRRAGGHLKGGCTRCSGSLRLDSGSLLIRVKSGAVRPAPCRYTRSVESTDLYFTQTIVGPAVSVVLGRHRRAAGPTPPGLEVDLRSGRRSFGGLWRDWIQLSHADDPAGLPRRRPGAMRRWLERHALWIAVLGLLSLGASVTFWLLALWVLR